MSRHTHKALHLVHVNDTTLQPPPQLHEHAYVAHPSVFAVVLAAITGAITASAVWAFVLFVV